MRFIPAFFVDPRSLSDNDEDPNEEDAEHGGENEEDARPLKRVCVRQPEPVRYTFLEMLQTFASFQTEILFQTNTIQHDIPARENAFEQEVDYIYGICL